MAEDNIEKEKEKRLGVILSRCGLAMTVIGSLVVAATCGVAISWFCPVVGGIIWA
jgi:hypothetical protein